MILPRTRSNGTDDHGAIRGAVLGGVYVAGALDTCIGLVRVRFQITRNARIENVGKCQSCMVSKLRIIWKQTVSCISQLLHNRDRQ